MAKNTTNATAEQKAKISALNPIIKNWNRVHQDSWKIGRPGYETDGVHIYREKKYEGFFDNIHGCLVTDIAGICNAYGWCWAVYNDPAYNGIYVNI